MLRTFLDWLDCQLHVLGSLFGIDEEAKALSFCKKTAAAAAVIVLLLIFL